jgi:uncharacterized coiled-coil protein SlyX
MDLGEEMALLRSRVSQLEEKVSRQRRELDSLKKQVASLDDIVDELERQLVDDSADD